jgi:hypothetical protein
LPLPAQKVRKKQRKTGAEGPQKLRASKIEQRSPTPLAANFRDTARPTTKNTVRNWG